MTSAQQQLIGTAFAEDQELQRDVASFLTTHPDATQLMTRVLSYFQARQSTSSSQQPDAKRPKLDSGIAQFFQKSTSNASSAASSPTTATTTSAMITTPLPRADIGPAIYATSPLSFLHPVRKKLVLSLHRDHVAIKTATPTNQEVICQAPYSAIHRVVAVPFLERTTKQTALILWFKHADLMAQGGTSGAKDAIWAVPLADDGKDFSLTFHDQHKGLVGLTEDLKTAASISTPIPAGSENKNSNGTVSAAQCKKPDQILISIVAYMMHRSAPSFYSALDLIASPTTVLSPSSAAMPSYPHFSTHLKSNQGTLYLLPTGLLFAFRKPILFLPTTGIEAIGVHSVMTRTFDFEVVLNSESCSVEDLEGVPPESSKEAGSGKRTVGFSMVDRKEFERVEDWIKKSGIRDRSLSEDLKAKDKATTGAGSKKRNRHADGDDGTGDEEEGGVSSQSKKKSNDDDDDDEEDEDFAPESDEDHVMEEYDSNAGESGSDSEGGEGADEADQEEGSGDEEDEDELEETKAPVVPSKVASKVKRIKEEEDLGEESLGDDSADDEDDDEDEEDEEDAEDDEEEVEEDELEDD